MIKTLAHQHKKKNQHQKPLFDLLLLKNCSQRMNIKFYIPVYICRVKSLHANGLPSDAAAEQRDDSCDGENREPFDVCQLKE